MLQGHIARVAAAGKLRIPEERAVALFHSAAVGIVLTLLRSHKDSRDLALSRMARDGMLPMIAITEDVSSDLSPIAAAATTLDTAVTLACGFSDGEFVLFEEWLGRIKGGPASTLYKPKMSASHLSEMPTYRPCDRVRTQSSSTVKPEIFPFTIWFISGPPLELMDNAPPTPS